MEFKIFTFTSTRAEYGLLKNIIIKLNNFDKISHKLIVSGTHLSKYHGFTIDNIKKDNIVIDYTIDMNINGDSSENILNSSSKLLVGLKQIFNFDKPNYIILLGDRYELSIVAFACLIYNIKIIHLCGGDTTLGAYDEKIRNGISQYSNIHIVSNIKSKEKLENMGIHNNIFNYGNPGLEELYNYIPKKSKHELLKEYFNDKVNDYIMFVYHSETNDLENLNSNLNILLKFLIYILDKKNIGILVIGPNADNSFNKINKMYDSINHENFVLKSSLSREKYLDLSKHCSIFVGNSSSGIYEIPHLGKYVINIGNRQKGRYSPQNVIHVKHEYNEIINNIDKYINKEYYDNNNLYECKPTSKLLLDLLINLS